MRNLLLRSALLVALPVAAAVAQRDTAFTWSRRLAEGTRFSIRNYSGMIDVRPGATDRVEVRATLRLESRGNPNDISFEVREPSAGEIEICTVYRGVSACDPDLWSGDMRVNVRYIVELPRGLRFRGSTGNGDVLVMQSAAEVDASTGNGDVVVRESLGRASATTGNGDVTIAAANGAVKATTGNGRVTVNIARGPVEATSGNGDVDVRITSIRGADLGPTSVSSGNGDVRVSLPADFSGEIDASTGSGKIATDFDVRLQGSVDGSRLRGTIGNGNGPLIKLRSGHGRLEIRRG